MTYTLRPYQIQAINDSRANIAAGTRKQVIVVPTGGGKTIIGAEIFKAAVAKGSTVLFAVHRIELLNQTLNKLSDCGIVDVGVIKAGFDENASAQVQVASVPTLTKRLARHNMRKFKLAIFDEAHHARADTWQAIIDELDPTCAILGLTATPYRADGKGLGTIFDAMVIPTTINELIDQGHLVPSRTFAGNIVDLSKVKITGGDYNKKELEAIMSGRAIVGNVVDSWKKWGWGRQTIMFCPGVEHSKMLTQKFIEIGVKAAHVDGYMQEDDRLSTINDFNAGRIQMICNYGVLTEGFDAPPVSLIGLLRPTKSRGLYRQMTGRGMRPWPGKTDLIILDHANCVYMHGHVTDPDDYSLANGVRPGTGPQFQCPKCRATFIGWPKFCPGCGYQLPRGERETCRVIENESIEMQEITPDSVNKRIVYYNMLQQQAMDQGMKPGYADVRYKQRFGQWPNGMVLQNAIYQTRWTLNPIKGTREKVWAKQHRQPLNV